MGLALIKINQGGRICERSIKNDLTKIFATEGLEIEIDPASQVVDYLDVKLNLDKHTHEPYRKKDNPPLYLNVNSNHPKHVIRHIPKMIEQRLSILSSTEAIFKQSKK